MELTGSKLITIEGIDGSGKSTLAEKLALDLAIGGLECHLMREPGGVELAEKIRELVQNTAVEINPRAEALLYAAARAQLVEEKLKPLLDSNLIVILDRFVDSSLAYQGGGRQLDIETIRKINDFATDGIKPDLTLLLQIDPQIAQQRLNGRNEGPDRLEQAGESFFQRVADNYSELAKRSPDRIVVINGELDPQQLHQAALTAVKTKLFS